MKNHTIDHDLYKPLVNYKYTYSGGVILSDNRADVNESKIRYQNSYSHNISSNPISYNGVLYNNSTLYKMYIEDSALIFRNRFKRDGSYTTQKVYYKINPSFLSSTSFLSGDLLYFIVKFYKRTELSYNDGKNFYLESIDQTTFSSTAGNSNNYSSVYKILEIPFTSIVNTGYLEIDLGKFKFNYEGDPYYEYLFRQGVDICLYELRLYSFYKQTSGSYVYLQPILTNENTVLVSYKNRFSESNPQYLDGNYLRIGSTFGSNNFYIDVYDREYLINNSTAYTIYKTSTLPVDIDPYMYESETVPDGYKKNVINWISESSVNVDTGSVVYSDENKLVPSAEAIQKDSNNNIKRIFWRFDVGKTNLNYYGKLLQAYLIFYVNSVEKYSNKFFPLNYIVRASSLPDYKYQNWTSGDVDNNTLNEMYEESTVLYNGNYIFGGNGDIDGSLTYGKSPNCILDSGFYFSDISGHPIRCNYRGGDYSDLDYRRRMSGVTQIENYRYNNSNINSITLIIEDIYPSISHTYTKSTVLEDIYFGINRYSTTPCRKSISSSINSEHSYKPFIIIGAINPRMFLYDDYVTEIPDIYRREITINAGETPADYVFYIENAGRGFLNPAISKSGDDSNLFIQSMTPQYEKRIVNKMDDVLSIDERENTISTQSVTVSFKQINTPGIYGNIKVVLTEIETHEDIKTREIEFTIIVNNINDLKITTIEPDLDRIFVDPTYEPEISTVLNMEFTYGDTSTKSYDIYSWNSGAGNINVISNKFYDAWSLSHLDPYNSSYRYSQYDFDPFYFSNSQGTDRYFYVTNSAVFNYKIDVNISCFVDQSEPNILINGDISTDNWPSKNDCTTISGLRSTNAYKLNSSDSYSTVTTPTFNLNKNKFYRFDLYARITGSGFDFSKISIKLLDSSNNVLKDLTPTTLPSILGSYGMRKFVYLSDQDYTNCKIKFENTNTTSSRVLYIEAVSVKECKPLPAGLYSGYLEFWNYDNPDPNENKIYLQYNLNVKPRVGYQESTGVLFV